MSHWGGVYICNIPEAARSNLSERHSICLNTPMSPPCHVHSGCTSSMFAGARNFKIWEFSHSARIV